MKTYKFVNIKNMNSFKGDVMRYAWHLYKDAGCTTRAEFGVALSEAWKVAYEQLELINEQHQEAWNETVNKYRVHYSVFAFMRERAFYYEEVRGSYDKASKTIEVCIKNRDIEILENEHGFELKQSA